MPKIRSKKPAITFCKTCRVEIPQLPSRGRTKIWCSYFCQYRQKAIVPHKPRSEYVFPEYIPIEALKRRQLIYRATTYGMSISELISLYEKQHGKCAICMIAIDLVDSTARIDHNHLCCPQPRKTCGRCTRGLLCNRCNTGLGIFRDNSLILNNAIRYLEMFADVR